MQRSWISTARAAVKELVVTIAFSAACAVVVTALGSAATTLFVHGEDGGWEVLSLRSHLALAIPAFFAAWLFRLFGRRATSTRARAAWTAGLLAVCGAAVHRIALWTDGAAAKSTVIECVDDVCVSVVRADADLVATAFAAMRTEATYVNSLLWASVAVVALAAAVAYALQPRLRVA